MKHLNLKITSLLIIMMLFSSFKGVGQNAAATTNDIMGTINASGNDATGSSGTVAYSIGQVFYTYIGLSVYNVAQGVQHEEVNNNLAKPENNIETKAEIFIFPNPTTDFVNIKMEGFENEVQSYQLYDLQGRLLKQNNINQTETQVSLNDFSSSIYILQVFVNNKVFKTFKILKK